jgi:hypothetical protein
LIARYRAIPFEKYHLDPDRDLIHALSDGRTLVEPKSTCLAMRLCGTFQPLSAHSQRIRSALKNSADKADTASRMLAELERKGLLISEEDFCSSIPAGSCNNASISALFVITAGRPAACGRALSSFIENNRRSQRQVRFTVMDDSLTLQARASCVHEVEACAEKLSEPIWYCGREEKESYIADLKRHGIDGDVARFALLGDNHDGLVTIGANRNCALLDSIGEAIFSVDDDLVCQTAPHPSRTSNVRLCGHHDTRDYWTFKDRDAVIAGTKWEAVDLLEQHEQLLGVSIGSLASQGIDHSGIDIQGSCDHMLIGMLKGTANVVATVGGIAGDSGGRAAKWMLASSGQTMANLMASRASFDLALTSREVLGVAPRPSVTHKPFCQTANIGLDNRSLLPPFFPIGRGEDTVFGMLVASAFPYCFLGHIPFALLHEAEQGRTYEQSFEYRISELIGHLMASCVCPPGISRARALKRIGSHLEDIASLPAEDFWNVVLDTVRDQTTFSMRVAQTEFSLEKFAACPDYWQQEMLKWHVQTVEQLEDATSFVPYEFKNLYPVHVAKAKTRELLAQAGRLLFAWPDLIEAAQELRLCGTRLSKPLRTRATV